MSVFRARMFVGGLVVALFATTARTSAARADLLRGPPAPWVQQVDLPPFDRAAKAASLHLLHDVQVQVVADGAQTFVHRASAVLSSSAVADNSTLEVEREPTETVRWHFVRRIRAGETSELLESAQVRVIQPEAERDRGILNGHVREVVMLEDVRAGDVIEYAFTREERALPAAPKYVGDFVLAFGEPVGRVSLLVQWPKERKLALQAIGISVITPTPNSLSFAREGMAAYVREDNEPEWFDPRPRVQLSEYTSWQEVAREEAAFYPNAEPPESIRQELQTWKALPDPEARMRAAVRFVQDEIRYLGIEEGEKAFVPRAPADVLRGRHGDCKDKSYLLVSLLRALGFRAEPALVSVHWGRAIERMLPSPMVFDHAIVRAWLGEQELWIDPTRELQRGSLHALPSLSYGLALPLSEQTTALQAIPVVTPEQPEVEVAETYEVHDLESALHVRTIYRGRAADGMRARFAADSQQRLQANYQSFYGEHFSDVKPSSPLRVNDDVETDTLTVEEAYTFKGFWDGGERNLQGWSLLERLPKLGAARKPTPIHLPFPLSVRHVIEIHEPSGWTHKGPAEERIDSDAFSYHARVFISEPSVYRLEFELQTKVDHLTATQLEPYRADRERVVDSANQGFQRGGRALNTERGRETLYTVLGFIVGLVGLGFVVGWLKKRRSEARKRQFASAKRFASGETPQTAIDLEDSADLTGHLTRLRCCGQPVFSSDHSASDPIRYGGSTLSSYRAACSECGRTHRRYFRLS